MKVNTADAPYVVQKGSPSQWQFTLTYATVDQILLQLHEQLAASRMPYADRKEALQVQAWLDPVIWLCRCWHSTSCTQGFPGYSKTCTFLLLYVAANTGNIWVV